MATPRAATRWWPVVVAAGFTAAMTIASATWVYPRGSVNLDEVALRTQADAIAHGRLTLPAADYAPSFVPFLSAVVDDEIVFKYQPLWPAFVAGFERAGLGDLAARVVLAAAAPAAIAWLTWELFGRRRPAVAAAAVVAASPFVWLQGSTMLAYHPSMVLTACGAALLLRATRRGGAVVVAAGLVASSGLLLRPFDSVLVLVPVGLFALWRRRENRARTAAMLLVGAVPSVVAFLAYNARVSGSPFTMAFDLAGGRDRFGFGVRSSVWNDLMVEDILIHYDLTSALDAQVHSLAALPLFLFAAPVVAFAVIHAVRRHRRCAEMRLLGVVAAVVVVGYLFWWGTANMVSFGLHLSHGPAYHYPLLLALAPAAGLGIAELTSRLDRRRVASAALLALVWLPANALVLGKARDAGRDRSETLRGYEFSEPSLVIESPDFPGDPYVDTVVDLDLDGPNLVAHDDPDTRPWLLERFDQRHVELSRRFWALGDLFGEDLTDRVTLERVRAPVVELEISAGPELTTVAGSATVAFLRVGDSPPRRGGPDHGSFTVAAADIPRPLTVTVGFGVLDRDGGAIGSTFECRFAAYPGEGDDLTLVTPCDGYHHYLFPGGAEADSREQVDAALEIRVGS